MIKGKRSGKFKIPGLYPLKKMPKIYRIFGFDTETCNNNKDFVCGSIVGKNLVEFYDDKESMRTALISRKFSGALLVATNLLFDFFSLFSIQEAFNEWDILERQGSLILARTNVDRVTKKCYSRKKLINSENKKKFLKHGSYQIKMLDTGNYMKTSVENLGKICNIPKLEKPECLGERPKSQRQWEELKNYNIRDSLISYKFVEFIQYHNNSMGAQLKNTIAGTALDLFQRRYLEKPIIQEDRDKILFCYDAYYGGRTEAFKRGMWDNLNDEISVYDVNGLYPYVQSLYSYANPRISYWTEKSDIHMVKKSEGVGDFELDCPDMYYPFLPMKTDKLRFPVGKIKGRYDFAAIRYALSLGYQITKFGKALVYPEKFRPFKKIHPDLYKLRFDLQEQNNPGQLAIKLDMNGLGGRFGYRYNKKEKIGNLEAVHMALLSNMQNKDNFHIEPIDGTNLYRICTTSESKIPFYVFPIFSLSMTSRAREHMHKLYLKSKTKYTDTDCIFTQKKLKTGIKLGDLKKEHIFKKLIIIKPKFYGGIDFENNDIIKIKGLYGSLKSFSDFQNRTVNDDFEIERQLFRKLRSAIRRPQSWVNEVYPQLKRMTIQDDKRYWSDKFNLDIQDSTPLIYN